MDAVKVHGESMSESNSTIRHTVWYLVVALTDVVSHNKRDKVFLSESFGSFQLLAENEIPGQKRVVIHMQKRL
jgi:hypothetical protein